MKQELINANNIEASQSKIADKELPFLLAVQGSRYKMKIALAKIEKVLNEI